jgi:Ion channel
MSVFGTYRTWRSRSAMCAQAPQNYLDEILKGEMEKYARGNAEPDAFSGLAPLQDNLSVAHNLIYFSFVTLTTVGYGDIVPIHPFARSLANVEAIIGQLYPATLLARLVTLEIESRRVR